MKFEFRSIVLGFIVILTATEYHLTGQVQGGETVDDKILQYCSLDAKKEKKSLGEMEQEFLQALQVLFLYLLL